MNFLVKNFPQNMYLAAILISRGSGKAVNFAFSCLSSFSISHFLKCIHLSSQVSVYLLEILGCTRAHGIFIVCTRTHDVASGC